MSEHASASPFAPPRAGRMAWFWRRWFDYCRACPRFACFLATPLEKIATGWMLLPVCCVPLLGVRIAGRPLLRRFALPLFVLAAFFALACIGQIAGGIALGLMAALHALGIAEYLDERFPPSSDKGRIVRRGGLALACAILAIRLGPSATRWLAVPVGTSRGIVLFNPLDRNAPFAPQAMVAFDLPRYRQGGFQIDAAIYPGRVIASPGDRVEFSPGVVTVNGVPQPALPLMPVEGSVSVPPGRVLVWPVEMNIRAPHGIGGWNLPPDVLLLGKSALVGRPYRRWFWRTFTA